MFQLQSDSLKVTESETSTVTLPAEPDETLDSTKYFESRLAMLNDARASGIDVYPHKFTVSMSIPQFIVQFSSVADGEHFEDTEVSVAGEKIQH